MTGPDTPAFPETKVYAYRCTDEKHGGEWTPPMVIGHGGMTKREYFAAQAMQGLLAFGFAGEIAEEAVKQADMLIAELNK